MWRPSISGWVFQNDRLIIEANSTSTESIQLVCCLYTGDEILYEGDILTGNLWRIGDYDWGRCHVSVCTKGGKSCFPLSLISLLITFMLHILLGKRCHYWCIAVGDTDNKPTYTWENFHVRKTDQFLLVRRWKSYDIPPDALRSHFFALGMSKNL